MKEGRAAFEVQAEPFDPQAKEARLYKGNDPSPAPLGSVGLQLPGRKQFERLEAASEFGRAQPVLAKQPSQIFLRGPLPFLRVAFHARRDQIAVRIAPHSRPWHDMVEALQP